MADETQFRLTQAQKKYFETLFNRKHSTRYFKMLRENYFIHSPQLQIGVPDIDSIYVFFYLDDDDVRYIHEILHYGNNLERVEFNSSLGVLREVNLRTFHITYNEINDFTHLESSDNKSQIGSKCICFQVDKEPMRSPLQFGLPSANQVSLVNNNENHHELQEAMHFVPIKENSSNNNNNTRRKKKRKIGAKIGSLFSQSVSFPIHASARSIHDGINTSGYTHSTTRTMHSSNYNPKLRGIPVAEAKIANNKHASNLDTNVQKAQHVNNNLKAKKKNKLKRKHKQRGGKKKTQKRKAKSKSRKSRKSRK